MSNDFEPISPTPTSENITIPQGTHPTGSSPSETSASDSGSESNADFQKRTSITVGSLRRQYGPTFAQGYGDEDKIGEVLGRAGVNSVEEYIEQHKRK